MGDSSRVLVAQKSQHSLPHVNPQRNFTTQKAIYDSILFVVSEIPLAALPTTSQLDMIRTLTNGYDLCKERLDPSQLRRALETAAKVTRDTALMVQITNCLKDVRELELKMLSARN